MPDETTAPFLPWEQFVEQLDWRQGEHVALVGPTGRGKTTLALALLPLRKYTVILGTKPKDSTLNGLAGKRGEYVRIRSWPPPPTARRVLLWPPWRDNQDTPRQAAIIRTAIERIFREEAWCIFADDVQYLTDMLKLGPQLRMLWLQARSLKISVMAATQRPVWTPREMWTQSTHLFIWGTQDAADLKALAGFGGMNTKVIREWVASLGEHDVLYLNLRRRVMLRTQAPRR